MLSETEQKHIILLAEKLASVYHKDKALAKRLNLRFNSKTKSIQQAKSALIEFLKEAG
jgi:hypothetical protein